ncbi:transposase [Rhodospirillum sp. A1_3_36]|uniref:transposase n=1 Tax=Rhodospirillum sp. A1_3_36 TaxID=3391666 RepID=UPI0039A59EDF
MMTPKTQRSFTDAFKQETVALLQSSGWLLGQIAAELGIQPFMVRNWCRRFAGPGGTPRSSDRQAVRQSPAPRQGLRLRAPRTAARAGDRCFSGKLSPSYRVR